MGNLNTTQKQSRRAKHQEMAKCIEYANKFQIIHNYDDAIKSIKRSIELAKQLGDRHHENQGHQSLLKLYPTMGRIEEIEGHLRLGIAHQRNREYDKAVEKFQKSIKLAKHLGDKSREIRGYSCLVDLYEETGQAENFLESSKKVAEVSLEMLGILKSTGSQSTDTLFTSVLEGCFKLGNVYLQRQEYEEAVNLFNMSIDCSKHIGAKPREMIGYFSLGRAYKHIHQHQEAVDNFKKCIALAKELGSKQVEMLTYDILGSSYVEMENYEDAINCFGNNHIHLARELGDSEGELSSYHKLANIYQQMHKYNDAIHYRKRALDKAIELGNKPNEMLAYSCVGITLTEMLKFDEAVYYTKKCIELAKELNNKEQEMTSNLILGDALMNIGQYDAALECTKRSFYLIKETDDKRHEVITLNTLLDIHQKMNPQESLMHCINALCKDLAEESPCKHQDMLYTYFVIGRKYFSSDQYQTALECFKSSLDLSNEIKDRQEKMKILGFLSDIYEKLGQRDNSIESTRKQIDLAHDLVEKEVEMVGYGSLIEKFQEMHQNDDAVDCCKKYSELARQIGAREQEMLLFKTLGCIYQEMHQYNDAVESYQKSLDIAKELGDNEEVVMVGGTLAKLYLEMGNPEGAASTVIDFYNKAKDFMIEYHQDDSLAKGMQSISSGRHDEAIVLFKKSINQAIESGNLQKERTAYCNLQAIYLVQAKYEDAIACMEKVAGLSRELGDEQLEMETYLQLSESYAQNQQLDESVAVLNNYVSLAQQKRNTTMEMKGYYHLGELYLKMSKDALAHTNVRELLDAERASQTRLIDAAENGPIEKSTRSDSCIGFALKCLEMAKDIGNRQYEMMAHFTLFEVYFHTTQFGNAYTNATEGAHIANELNDEKMRRKFQKSLGQIKMSITDDTPDFDTESASQVPEKIKSFYDLLKFPEIKLKAELHLDKEKELAKLLEYYNSSKDYEKCIEVLEKLKELSTSIDRKVKYSSLIADFIFQVKGGYEALQYCEKVLPEVRQSTNEEQFDYYSGIAQLYYDNLQFELAVKYFREAIQCFNNIYLSLGYHENMKISITDKSKYIACVRQFSRLLFITAQYEEAILVLDQCRGRVLRETLLENYKMSETGKEQPFQYSDVESLLSTCKFSLLFYWFQSDSVLTFVVNKLKKKLPTFSTISSELHQSIISAFDILGLRLVKCEDRSLESAFNDKDINEFHNDGQVKSHQRYINEYRDSHENLQMPTTVVSTAEQSSNATQEEASSTNEAHSDMATLENLAVIIHTMQNMKGREIHSLEHLNDDIGLRERCNELSKQTPEDLEMAGKFLRDLLIKHLARRLKPAGPQNVSNEIDCTDVRPLQVSRDGNAKSKPIRDMTKKSLERNIYDDPWEDEEVNGTTKILQTLFKLLINKSQLDHDEIVIVPDGAINTVPFAALQDPDTGYYLSETKRIRFAPSIQSLVLMKQSPDDFHYQSGALIIGDPAVGRVMLNGRERFITPLEGARREANEIANVLGVRPLIGDGATKEAVIEKLKQGVSVVHIAAHGILSKASIALAPTAEVRSAKTPDEEDYMLTMADVQKAQVRAKLVVLGCCHSGRGEIKAEGVVGMCRAFLASGARAVIGSLWACEDTATLVFMKHFYWLLKQGKSACLSLQETMRYMRDDTIFSEPKFWATFFLIGDDVTVDF